MRDIEGMSRRRIVGKWKKNREEMKWRGKIVWKERGKIVWEREGEDSVGKRGGR